MRTVKLILLLALTGFYTSCNAQIKHARIVTVRIDGDCPMCEKTIERVGLVKGESSVDWDVDAKTAVITFDTTRTDLDAILKRVALAGYDNALYLAPEAAYKQLPGCCQYDRRLVHAPLKEVSAEAAHVHMDSVITSPAAPDQDVKDPFDALFATYFELKDALVATDVTSAKAHAAELTTIIVAVDMGALDHDVHMVWMDVMKPMAGQVAAIASATDIEVQRKAFMALTEPFVRLAKVAPRSMVLYLDHCPMYEGGADWLSREKPIKNPFYGSMMMTCGSVKQTITK